MCVCVCVVCAHRLYNIWNSLNLDFGTSLITFSFLPLLLRCLVSLCRLWGPVSIVLLYSEAVSSRWIQHACVDISHDALCQSRPAPPQLPLPRRCRLWVLSHSEPCIYIATIRWGEAVTFLYIVNITFEYAHCFGLMYTSTSRVEMTWFSSYKPLCSWCHIPTVCVWVCVCLSVCVCVV